MTAASFVRGFFSNAGDARVASLLPLHLAESVHAAAELSALMAELPKFPKERLAMIVRCEHAGDRLTGELRTLFDEVFIFKRLSKEHGARLVSHLDDILDDMKDAARHIDTYMIDYAPPQALDLASEIGTMVGRLSELVRNILTLSSAEVETAYAELKKIERRADEQRSSGVKALALLVHVGVDPGAKTMALYRLLAWRDIYAKLERVTDHCVHAAAEIAVMVRSY